MWYEPGSEMVQGRMASTNTGTKFYHLEQKTSGELFFVQA